MGGAVSISAPKLDKKTLFMQDLVNDDEAIKTLFKNMTMYGKSRGVMNSNSDLLSLAEILLYIEKEVNAELSLHYKGMVEMIKESFFFIVGYKKKVRLEIPSKRFHNFMYAMFMFSHLWKIFAAADDHIDDDSIFVGEFIRAKDKIKDIDGVDFTHDISDEEWKEEFKKIDSGGRGGDGGNGWISFREFANYCCSAIATPEVYSKAGGVKKQDEVGYVAPAKPELIQIEFEGAIQHEIVAMVPRATIRKSSVAKPELKQIQFGGAIQHDVTPRATVRKSSSTSVRKSSAVRCEGSGIVELGNNSNKTYNKPDTAKIVKNKKIVPVIKKKKNDDSSTNKRQLPLKKKSAKKKGGKKSNAMHSKSSPALSNEPMNIDTTMFLIKTDTVDDENADNNNNNEPDPLLMDECSSPIDTKVIIDVVALEKKEEEDHKRALEEYVRPLYRPRSAAEIHQDVRAYRSWVDNVSLQTASCKSWVPNETDAFAVDTGSKQPTPPPAPGFGISGVDIVSFTYDMDEAQAEATTHKKYLYRRKPKGNLWQPKHTTRRFQRDNL